MNAVRSLKTRSRHQRGATLVVGLIMLVLITFIVVNAFNLSSSNLKAVGNVQVRAEAVAAANRFIEELVQQQDPYTNPPVAGYSTTINLTDDDDKPSLYTVQVAPPVCVRAVIAASTAPSDVELGAELAASTEWDVDFEFVATVQDAGSGANVEVRQGVRVRMNQFQRDARCS